MCVPLDDDVDYMWKAWHNYLGHAPVRGERACCHRRSVSLQHTMGTMPNAVFCPFLDEGVGGGRLSATVLRGIFHTAIYVVA